jgi:His-Xaa-Ser system protein HxsD
MNCIKFRKELYSKISLIKAAYNFTDRAYVHLDADDSYYYVTVEAKDSAQDVCEQEFLNEMLAQSVRHEVYQQTKNIRELLLARAMATSVIVDEELVNDEPVNDEQDESFAEDEILKDWFAANEENTN